MMAHHNDLELEARMASDLRSWFRHAESFVNLAGLVSNITTISSNNIF